MRGLPRGVVGMEASGGAQYWARQLDDSAPVFRRIRWMGSWHWGSPSSFLPNTVYESVSMKALGRPARHCGWSAADRGIVANNAPIEDGGRESVFVVENEAGVIVTRGSVPTTVNGLKHLRNGCGLPAATGVALETGTSAFFVARELARARAQAGNDRCA